MDKDEIQSLSDAPDFDSFKKLRHAKPEVEAEPAEKAPQAEEATSDQKAEPEAAEQSVQEVESKPAEVSVDDQVKALRAKGKHAQANKLMADEAARPHREENEKLRKELEALRSRPSETPAPRVEPKPAAVPAPQAIDPSDPEPKVTDEKYAGADGFTLYNRDNALWAFRQETRKQQHEQAQAQHRDKVNGILEAARKAHADFDAVSSQVVLNPAALQEGVNTLDNLADVIYKIGNDPTEISRIRKLTPNQQYAELVIVSRELSKPPAPAPAPLKPAVSRAAAPPRSLGGASAPPVKTTAEAAEEGYESFRNVHGLSRFARQRAS